MKSIKVQLAIISDIKKLSVSVVPVVPTCSTSIVLQAAVALGALNKTRAAHQYSCPSRVSAIILLNVQLH